jgi:hypothetical protein
VCRSAELRDEVLSNLESAPDALLAPALLRVTQLKRRFPAHSTAASAPPYAPHAFLAARIRA